MFVIEPLKKPDTRAVKLERRVQSGCEAERYPRLGPGGSPVSVKSVAEDSISEESKIPEDKTEFEVILADCPSDAKIDAIKKVGEVTDLGLTESKEIVDNIPSVLKENVSREQAEEIKKMFEDIGAAIEIK